MKMILLLLSLWIVTVTPDPFCFDPNGSCQLIATSPCYSEVATNFTGLLFSLKTNNKLNNTFSVNFGGEITAITINKGLCTVTVKNGLVNIVVNCSMMYNHFRIDFNLVSTHLEGNMVIKCSNDAQEYGNQRFSYKDCPATLPHDVEVVATQSRRHYNDPGEFKCVGVGSLYQIGKALLQNDTRCVKDATWLNQQGLECWNATLRGTDVVYNATDIGNFQCILSGNTSAVSATPTFYINNTFWNVNNPLTKKLNGANITCKLTIQKDNSTITSQQHLLNIQYRPTDIVAKVINKTRFINGKYFLQPNVAISLNCSFIANPPANCCWVENKTNETLNCTTSKNNCQLTKLFNMPSDVKCKGCNIVGCSASQVLSIVPLSLHRTPTIYVNSSLNENVSVWNFNVTQVVHLQCNVSYQDDLSTTIKWFHNNGLQNNGSIGNNLLVDLNVSSGGNYTCQANDTFLPSNALVEINVHYPPYQQNNFSICYLETLEDCDFDISSNPPIESAVLTRSEPQANWTLMVNNSTTFEFVFNISYGNGSYELMVGYNGAPRSFNFTAISGPKPTTTAPPESPTTTPDNPATPPAVYIAVGVSLLGAGVVVLVVVLVVRRRKGGKKQDDQSEREERQNPIYATSGDANANGGKDIYTPVNFKAKKNKKVNSEKEERANPLYASSSNQDAVQDVYASVDKKKKEKEVRVNPIYDTSVASGNKEVTYGVVNKKNKKIKVKSEKEVKVNVLYGASGSGNQLEDVYALVDKSKKNEKEERLNPLYGGVNDVARSSGDTYSTVNKPNKKKKKKDKKRAPPPNPPNPPDPGEQDADPYAEVDLHGQSSNK